MKMRPATPVDAEAGSLVLRRSISELCHADHGGDPAAIAAWTGNKTAEQWHAWLARRDATLLVADRGGQVVGVGMVDQAGQVLLNYVAPEARFAGVSSALLAAMEDVAARGGLAACTLESTKTAERFYVARGYEPMAGRGSGAFTKRLGRNSTSIEGEPPRW